jgi:hypothetical protein
MSVFNPGIIWTKVRILSEMLKALDGDDRKDAIQTFQRESPELASYIQNLSTDPLHNYHPFDVEPGILPSGDPKSSPLAFHQDQSKQRVIVTGNRCSKTYSGAAEVISACVGMDPVTKEESTRFKPPLSCWAVSDTEQASIEVVQETYHRLMPEYLIHKSCSYNPRTGWKNNIIQFNEPFNSIIRFRYSSQSVTSFYGPKRDIIHLDEEQPEDVDDECVARTAGIDGAPGEIIRTFTPIYRPTVGISWIYPKLYSRRSEIPDLAFFFWTLWDVPDYILPDKEKRRLVASYDTDNRDTRVLGLFQPAGIRLGFATSIIKEQRENFMTDPETGYLIEEEYEVELPPANVRFHRGPAMDPETETMKRVVFQSDNGQSL